MRRPPEGWAGVETAEGWLWAPKDDVDRLRAVGLERPWELVLPRQPGAGTGRGACATLRPPAGPPLFVKHYLRGGLLSRVNRDRYLSLARFRRELEVGRRARAAGLPLGEVFAQVFRPGRPGWRAWGIARHVDGGVDLARLVERADADEAARLWRAALDTLRRMGETGLDHPDLNLGNLVGAPRGPGKWLFHVVDLDRARFTGGALSLDARHRMLARLERSWSRVFGHEGRLPSRARREIAREAGAP